MTNFPGKLLSGPVLERWPAKGEEIRLLFCRQEGGDLSCHRAARWKLDTPC